MAILREQEAGAKTALAKTTTGLFRRVLLRFGRLRY